MMPLFQDEAFLRKWAVRIALVWFAVLYARTAWVSRDEHAAGVVAMQAGDVQGAIVHHRRALRHAAPPFDAASESLSALFEIADAARARRDVARELAALHAVRGSIVASRWLFPRRTAARERADSAIARVVATPDGSPSFRGLSRADLERTHLRALEAAPGERPYGVLLAVSGLLAFVYFAHRLLTYDVGVDDVWDVTAARATALRMAAAFVAFVVGLVVT